MKKNLLVRIAAGLATTVALAFTGAAQAAYPDKAIKLISPFPPGGQVANIAYIMSQKMGQLIGQPMIMETRAGAGGQIAANAVAKGPKDGYQLLFATSSMLGIAKFMNKDLPYDPVTDFAPVAYLGNVTVGIFASATTPFTTFEQVIAFAKANPGKLAFSSPGIGSVSHLAGELLWARAGIKLVHVPYAGNSVQMSDLISGQHQIAMSGMVSGLPYSKDGKTRLLGVVGPTRSKMVPNVPAIGESMPGYDAPAWLGIVAPAGLAREALERLEAVAQQALADAETRKALEGQGVDLNVITAKAFGDKIKGDMPLWEEAVKAAGGPPAPGK